MLDIEDLDWNEDGLIPVIAQDSDGTVLTLAYMDKEALELSLETGKAHYYSRSKQRIRMKGEVSGNLQKVEEIDVDCDRDALLMKVEQSGDACHTGNHSCFFRSLTEEEPGDENSKQIDYSLNTLKELEEVIKDRKVQPKEGSYTASLFSDGEEEINKKLGEESIEVLVADERKKMISESADLLYHLLVKLSFEDIELKDVMEELRGRRQ
ncbi:MAG: bifunctional phosphoribosyl-AMP cyclohydrolase/phosphoribosyl-ATP diphosphatase HisIE [Candidatus Thermoplasmatota archaeon]|nr:bifunctional phosphoribosyl-AMP cyclohydrolase/phosphoribosyl-ATP diphosphatase HisIE [Candidatus Thermoplasmatota archaeon]